MGRQLPNQLVWGVRKAAHNNTKELEYHFIIK